MDNREIALEELMERYNVIKELITDDRFYFYFPLQPGTPEAIFLLLTNFSSREISIEYLSIVKTIRDFVGKLTLWPSLPEYDKWSEVQIPVVKMCDAIFARPDWPSRIEAVLKEENESTFWAARAAATIFDIDTWEQSFKRIKQGKSEWFFVSNIDDLSQAERVLQYAEELLSAESPLVELNWVFICLSNFADLQMRLIETCLGDSRSEVRYRALTSLRERPRLGLNLLGKRIVDSLTDMRDNDPDYKTKIFAGNVLQYHSDKP